MIIDTVITATNILPLYYDFIPTFIKAWNILFPEVNVKIILVHDHIPDNIKEYTDNIILFKPLKGINTAFISQIIRLFYPALIDTDKGVLITDIDMIPMNRTYYTEHIKKYSADKFICYRDVLLDLEELPMCYNVAVPNIWGEIFNVHNIDDIRNIICGIYNQINYDGNYGGSGWTTDQKLLYDMVLKWNKQTGNLILLNDKITNFLRMDRIYGVDIHDKSINDMITGRYSDYHMLRPYTQHKNKNDQIIDILKNHQDIKQDIEQDIEQNIKQDIKPAKSMKLNRRLLDANNGTFMECLISTVINTRGDVLELGLSDYSTPIIHSICKKYNRFILSTSTDRNNVDNFADLQTGIHNVVHITEDDQWDIIGDGLDWSVVFVNHNKPRMAKDVARLRRNTDIFVVYDYDCELFDKFKYKYTDNRYNKKTIVLSDKINVFDLFMINGINKTDIVKNTESLAGHHKSNILDSKNIGEWQYIDDAGHVYPWYTKPFLDELSGWCVEDWDVFEYGCGYSSIWWSIYANSVTSVENNYNWACALNDYYNNHNINNTCVKYRIINEKYDIGTGGYFSPYVNSINEDDKLYDCIVIDGECRNTCVYEALKHIKKGGIIILDNADQESVGLNSKETFRVLSKYERKSFKQENHQDWKTDYWVITDDPPTARSFNNRTLSDPEYGTHMTPLITAVISTTGPVFELGCGDYSTPLLHSICKKQNRYLLSTDTSKEWIKLFINMKSDIHDFVYVPVYEDDWEKNPVPELWNNIGNDKRWGVAFIDHRPGERRKDDIKRLKDKSDIIVVHDTEQPAYGYEPILNKFKFRYDYKRYNIYTTIVSDTVDVTNFF